MRNCSLSLCLALFACACHSPEKCPVRGRTRACVCEDEREGVQRCLPEFVWSACECGMAAGDAGTDAGWPPMPGPADAGGTPDAAVPPIDGDDEDDAGAPPPADDAATATDAAAADAAPTADAAPDAAVEPPPFSGCSADVDCGAEGQCERVTAPVGFPPVEMQFGVCSAPCDGVEDCALPAGSYQATAVCDDGGRCRLDCSGFPVELTCPAGMACQPADPADPFNPTWYCTRP